MYCKLTACILIISCSGALGVSYALSMKKRIEHLKELQRIMNYMAGEIAYRHAVLGEVFLNAASKCGAPFQMWLADLGDKLTCNESELMQEPFVGIWRKSLDYIREHTKFKESDIRIMEALGQALGYLDINTQQMSLKLEQENLQNIIKQADMELANKMKVSVVMGTLGGVMIVILLI
ncbi:MAG: stage III sporulation protein AB [Clostridium sp.]|nr:stage III sporulation protein AB [Clostridium sp.]MCM1399435.1 stage III sporulation protein AB [Clostridium sp.]MCM1459989.1 stage III sporulation protein AB [Bacteroides sp.]